MVAVVASCFFGWRCAPILCFFSQSPRRKRGHDNDTTMFEDEYGSASTSIFSSTSHLVYLVSVIPKILRELVGEYVFAVRNMVVEVLEMVANGLQMQDKEAFSRVVKDEKSDSCFGMNHYPPCPEIQGALSGTNMVITRTHNLLSVLRSNSVSGFQICLGGWFMRVCPPDPTSFFFIVGNSL